MRESLKKEVEAKEKNKKTEPKRAIRKYQRERKKIKRNQGGLCEYGDRDLFFRFGCVCRSCRPRTRRYARCRANWSWCLRHPAPQSKCCSTRKTHGSRHSSARSGCWKASWSGCSPSNRPSLRSPPQGPSPSSDK